MQTQVIDPSIKSKNEPPVELNPEIIRKMFSEISTDYDLANSVMSAGIHHLWRRSLVRWSGAKEGDRVLDCATGTGDLAIAFKKTVGPSGDVIGTDFCQEMMRTAPLKAARHALRIKFQNADVTALPYLSDSFDVSSIAFGIRNVKDPVKALRELARVTRPGGKVMVLEFGQPALPGLSQAYGFYSRRVLPRLGGWITGRKHAYVYLQESSSRFPCGRAFEGLVKQAGILGTVEIKPVSFGIAYVYKITV